VRPVVLDNTRAQSRQARQLATALTAAADELDQGHQADVPLIQLLDEMVRRLGADEVCRRLNVSSIDKLGELARE
jgi:hypothetical protein